MTKATATNRNDRLIIRASAIRRRRESGEGRWHSQPIFCPKHRAVFLQRMNPVAFTVNQVIKDIDGGREQAEGDDGEEGVLKQGGFCALPAKIRPRGGRHF